MHALPCIVYLLLQYINHHPQMMPLLSNNVVCRFGYINWLWYGWGAVMINQYKNSDIKIYGDTGVLEYYSLNGIDEWAFLGYSALTFVFFFLVAYIVSFQPPAHPNSS